MKKTIFLGLAIIALVLNDLGSSACSSFMLKTKSGQIYGHNLNIGGKMPGMIFINKSTTLKNGYTWAQLISNDELSKPSLVWTSKYGSLTFNAFGREFPDGGMNENGLFIWEMTGKSTFDTTENRPRLFMAQWMQYQLDNFKNVEEVLQNISRLGIDGWNWHFFVADKQGKSASIEFVDGTAYVNTENNMPIPLMGNGRYSEDLSFLKEFEGFGGNIKIDENDPNLPGFVKAAKMINANNDQENLVDYGFNILGKLSSKSKWSVIFDVANMQLYFKTNAYQNIKQISLASIDFSSKTPVKTLNIQDAELKGDVTDQLKNFNQDDHLNLIKELIQKLFAKNEDEEINPDLLISHLANAYVTKDLKSLKNFEGAWTGYAEYPTTGDPAKVDWNIEFENIDGILKGKITDSAGMLTETEMQNIAFENGIFKFTVYSYGYIFRISASISNNEMKGIFDISDESRKGNFHLQLKKP
jgi:penicillin V acylase-like amidase (Ntn superfamily)